jgi:hypothetical protein
VVPFPKQPTANKFFLICYAVALLLAMATSSSAADSASLQDGDKNKVECLFYFFDFVDWPSNALPPESKTVIIGILGQNRFAEALRLRTPDKTINGQTIVIKQLSSPQEAKNCQMVFITSSEKDRLPQILEMFKSLPVLTVGEMPHFAQGGGIINFVVNNKNSFDLEINPEAAKQAQLNISSELLKLSKVKIVRN